MVEMLGKLVCAPHLTVTGGCRRHKGAAEDIKEQQKPLKNNPTKDLHTCFIDLSKAYDSVDRPLAWELFSSLGFPPKMLQLIKDLHDNTMCAMQVDKGRQGSWFQVSTGFKQGDVNAPLFFNVFLDSICRYIESKAGELGLRLAYNIDGHLTGRRRPNGSMPCWCLLYADDMVIFEQR